MYQGICMSLGNILRAQATPANISIKFVKLHILVCAKLVKYDLF